MATTNAEREKVTGEQVKDAMMSAGIDRVDHHECSFCRYMTNYRRMEDKLAFDPGCDCSWANPYPEPRTWQEAADWINMQTDEAHKSRLLEAFGFSVSR